MKKQLALLSLLTLSTIHQTHAMETKEDYQITYSVIQGAAPFAFNHPILISYNANTLFVQKNNIHGKPNPYNWSATIPELWDAQTLKQNSATQNEFGKKIFNNDGSKCAFKASWPMYRNRNEYIKRIDRNISTYEIDFIKKTITQKKQYDYPFFKNGTHENREYAHMVNACSLTYSDNDLYGIMNIHTKGIGIVYPSNHIEYIPELLIRNNGPDPETFHQDYFSCSQNNVIAITCFEIDDHKPDSSGNTNKKCALYNLKEKKNVIVEAKNLLPKNKLEKPLTAPFYSYFIPLFPHQSITCGPNNTFCHRYQASKKAYVDTLSSTGELISSKEVDVDYIAGHHLAIHNNEFRQALYPDQGRLYASVMWPAIYIKNLNNKKEKYISNNNIILLGAKLQWYLTYNKNDKTYVAHKATL